MTFISVLLFLNYATLLAVSLVLLLNSLKIKYHLMLSKDEHWLRVLDKPHYYQFSFNITSAGSVISAVCGIAGIALFIPLKWDRKVKFEFYDIYAKYTTFTWFEDTQSVASQQTEFDAVKFLQFVQTKLSSAVSWSTSSFIKTRKPEEKINLESVEKQMTTEKPHHEILNRQFEVEIAEEVDFANNIDLSTCDEHFPYEKRESSDEADDESLSATAWEVDDALGYVVKTPFHAKTFKSRRRRRIFDVVLQMTIALCLSVSMYQVLIATEFFESHLKRHRYVNDHEGREYENLATEKQRDMLIKLNQTILRPDFKPPQRRPMADDEEKWFSLIAEKQNLRFCRFADLGQYPPAVGWTNVSCINFYYSQFATVRRLALMGIFLPNLCFLVVIPCLLTDNTPSHHENHAQTRPRDNWVRGCGHASGQIDLGIQCRVEDEGVIPEEDGDDGVIVFADDDFRRISLNWLFE